MNSDLLLGIVGVLVLLFGVLFILLWAFRILAVLSVAFMVFMLSLPVVIMILVFVLFPPTLIVFLLGWFATLVGLVNEDGEGQTANVPWRDSVKANNCQMTRELGYEIEDREETQRTDKLLNNIDEFDEEGHTALMRAVKCGDLEAVKLLLERGADPSVKDNNFRTTTARHISIRQLKVHGDSPERREIEKILSENG